MVMPRSRSMSPESITRSTRCWCLAKVPACCRSLSTRVVLPWSTCAMIAMLRRGRRIKNFQKFKVIQYFSIPACCGASSISHPVRGVAEGLAERPPKLLWHFGFFHRLHHARHPLVALFVADGKQQVTCAQHRMAEAIGVKRRAAQPPGEEEGERVAPRLDARASDGPPPRAARLELHQSGE